MDKNWKYIDNYKDHTNGRVWIMWNPQIWDVKVDSSTYQVIHSSFYDKEGKFSHYLSAIYPHNLLTKRKELWEEIMGKKGKFRGPWIIIGDFNNVPKIHDRVGGNDVQVSEYVDL